jgi:hypothetical protein
MAAAQAFLAGAVPVIGPEFAKFPVKFSVCGEFVPETGAISIGIASQLVGQLMIVTSQNLERPATRGPSQIFAPSPDNKIGQSQSEIADSL